MDLDTQLANLMELYTARLNRLGYIYIQDSALAEDIVQESFIRAYNFMQKSDIKNPYPWLVRVLINQCRDIQRKQIHETVIAVTYEQGDMSTEEIYVQKEDFVKIRRSIFLLPRKYSDPIILFYFEEMTVSEIASALKMSSGTVKTRLARGRERLKKILLEGEKSEHRNQTPKRKTLLRSN